MLYTTPFITVYSCILAGLLGLCMGSFLNCLAWRIVHGESVLKGRSHCDVCGHVLTAKDLVPVVSFLLSRGKCRYCGAKLSRRHLCAEIATGAVYVALLLKYDISLQALQWLIFASVLLCCAFADLEGYIIPDGALLVGAAVRVVYLLVTRAPAADWIQAALGGFVIGGGLLAVVLIYEKVKKVEAMGGGDLKLLFVTGLYLGLLGNLLCLFAACVLGILFGIIAAKGNSDTPFPWGPAISMAAIFTALFGDQLIITYLGMF